MTNKEAIKELSEWLDGCCGGEEIEPTRQALRLAISALQAQEASAQPEIIRCKDCKWWGYDDDDGVARVCHAAKHCYKSPNWDIMIYRKHKGDFYCADAERRIDEKNLGESRNEP